MQLLQDLRQLKADLIKGGVPLEQRMKILAEETKKIAHELSQAITHPKIPGKFGELIADIHHHLHNHHALKNPHSELTKAAVAICTEITAWRAHIFLTLIKATEQLIKHLQHTPNQLTQKTVASMVEETENCFVAVAKNLQNAVNQGNPAAIEQISMSLQPLQDLMDLRLNTLAEMGLLLTKMTEMHPNDAATLVTKNINALSPDALNLGWQVTPDKVTSLGNLNYQELTVALQKIDKIDPSSLPGFDAFSKKVADVTHLEPGSNSAKEFAVDTVKYCMHRRINSMIESKIDEMTKLLKKNTAPQEDPNSARNAPTLKPEFPIDKH